MTITMDKSDIETSTCKLNLAGGIVDCTVFRNSGKEALAIYRNLRPEGSYVRIHSACFTGDTLGSHHCDCGNQLRHALGVIFSEGGLLIYELSHEGRGIGLFDKIRAYALQREGLDTVEANLALGRGVDERDFKFSVAILAELGLKSIRFHSHNPEKVKAVKESGILIEVLVRPLLDIPAFSQQYIQDKQEKMGHENLI